MVGSSSAVGTVHTFRFVPFPKIKRCLASGVPCVKPISIPDADHMGCKRKNVCTDRMVTRELRNCVCVWVGAWYATPDIAELVQVRSPNSVCGGHIANLKPMKRKRDIYLIPRFTGRLANRPNRAITNLTPRGIWIVKRKPHTGHLSTCPVWVVFRVYVPRLCIIFARFEFNYIVG